MNRYNRKPRPKKVKPITPTADELIDQMEDDRRYILEKDDGTAVFSGANMPGWWWKGFKKAVEANKWP